MFDYNEKFGSIRLTRGDTAYLEVLILDSEEETLPLPDGSLLVMTVRKEAQSRIEFQVDGQGGVIKILPEHTSHMEFGDYLYDIQVTMPNRDVSTYGPYKFKVLQEVTY